jgi:hypothetical protein
MRYLFIILCFYCFRLYANNQDSSDIVKRNYVCQQDKDSINKNSIYIEVLGCGIFGSLNYERILFNKLGNAISSRIGYGFLPINGYSHIIPLLVNYQTSINKAIVCEIGLGARYIYSKQGWGNPTYNNSLDIIGNTGFRFLILKHILLKIDFTPQFTTSEFIIGYHGNPGIYFGFSLGTSF